MRNLTKISNQKISNFYFLHCYETIVESNEVLDSFL